MNSELQTLLEGHRPLSLQSLTIPASLRVSFLAPHPDDFDAIGITMRFFRRNGNDIDVVLLTSGASGVEDGFGGAWTAEAKALLRKGATGQLPLFRFDGKWIEFFALE